MIRSYKCKRNLFDPRDYHYSLLNLSTQNLPEKVDLRSINLAPIYDQQSWGSCVSNAVSFVLQQKLGKLDLLSEQSRMFIYYNGRVLLESNKSKEDTGLYVRDGFESIRNYGSLLEVKYPYDNKHFSKKPTKTDYKNALNKFPSISYYSVPQTLNDLQTALVAGHFIVFGIDVYESFESDTVAKTGIVPMPKAKEQLLGGHSIVIIGYDNSTKMFIVRNSWGTFWGNKGYFYLPYFYVLNTKLASDFTILN